MKFENIKGWLLGIGIIATITLTVLGYAELPKKVKEVDKKAEQNTEEIKELSSTVEKYIAVQGEVNKGQEKREQLMFEIIQKLSDKNGRPQ